MKSMRYLYPSVVVALLMLANFASAAPYDMVNTYYGSNQSWLYGWSMAPVGSNKILVGSLQDKTSGPAAGAAYVMDASSSAILLTIPNPTPVEYDNFGMSLTPVGNDLLVGANREGHESSGVAFRGAAYLFNGATGSLTRTFTAPSPNGFSYGSAVATVGGNILIGEESAAGTSAVTAYLYNSANGNLIRTFPNLGARSGRTSANAYLAVAGANILVGAPGESSEVGKASLLDSTNGNLLRTFSNPFVTAQDNFGFTVANLPGNRFAISAPWADRGATNSGAVYIFDALTGSLLQTLLDPNPSTDGMFGISLASVGNNLLVGAPFDDFGATNDGAAYLFSINTGALLHTFHNPSPQNDDWFGKSVSAIGADFLIAAAEDNTVASQAGAIYRFEGPAVPEPSSIVLLGLGAVGLVALSRRRAG